MSEFMRHQATFIIQNELGLHARPAMLLVQSVSRLTCDVYLEKDGLEADAKSIMGVLTLAAEQGSRITVRAEGPDAEKAIHAIKKLVEEKFGED
ncbi:MAG TPA: HPr family phosphocarrier protein [bacterium]|nr:HPr family phosphocarrier protein [bacterium]HOL93037.1 HPr family phosphocarrier protein [bacterium]HPO99464.1 HPr family phosphocarrier protein [bacterium]HXK95816.1 HPr family phosphocarrier protein [bacterium]